MPSDTTFFEDDVDDERAHGAGTGGPPVAPGAFGAAAAPTVDCVVREGYLIDARTAAGKQASANKAPAARLWVTTWQDETGFAGEACMEGLSMPPVAFSGLDEPFELHLAAQPLQRLLADMTQDDVVFDGTASSCAVLQELVAARRNRTVDAEDAQALRKTIMEFAREFAASDAGDFDMLLAMVPDNAGVDCAAAQNLVEDPTRFHRWKESPPVAAWKTGWPAITQALRAIGERQLQAQVEAADQARPRDRG
jgi:hypothetical protein